jgi:arylsulfatase A-like enzyme
MFFKFLRKFTAVAFPAAVAAFWGTAEALITRLWGLRAVWRPVDFWESAFDRAAFYFVVAAAATLLAWAAALAVKGKRGAAASAPWRSAAVISLALAVNAGWLALALTATFEFKWIVSFDVREPGGFALFWVPFAVGAGGATVGLGFLLRALRRRAPAAGRAARAAGVILLLVLIAYHVIAPAARPVAHGPDVVFVVLDAWRADNFNAELMPHMTAFARRYGVIYRNARAAASWTSPSMGTIFTGEYPDVHAQRHLMKPWDRPPTVARALYDAGYDTYAVNANRLLQRHSYIVDGFDHYYFGDESPFLHFIHFYDTNWYGSAARAVLVGQPTYETSRRLARKLEAITARKGRRPRFIWVHFMDPHTPYAPPPGYYDAADAPYIGDYRPMKKERAPAHRRLYDGECRYMDDLLSPILEELAEGGRTAIVVAADHGEEFWEHKTYEHGKSLYDTVLRVPLIIARPGEPAGDFKDPVTLFDLGPTLLDVAGATKPAHMDGETLLRPPGGPPKLMYFGSEFTESYDYHPNRQNCVVWLDWKLVVPDADPDYLGEYYDERVDPAEKNPWLEQGPLAHSLRAALIEWRKAVAGKSAPEAYEDLSVDLRALGYIK